MLKRFWSLAATIQVVDIHAWVGRVVVWSAAAVTGIVIVLFAQATEQAINFFYSYQSRSWWLPLLVMPVVGISIVWLTRRIVPGASGSGIPQTIAALNSTTLDNTIAQLISIKIAVAKIFFVTLALAAGFSAGREGPSVQVGASVMYACRRFLPSNFSIDPRHLILAGGAAGISAAFNTPLAGIIFAIEELSRRFEQKTNGVIITAIVISGLVSISLLGNYTYFGSLHVGVIDKSIVVPVLLCGLLCGASGGLFSRTLLEFSDMLPSRITNFRSKHPFLWTAICALLVALLGAVSHGSAYGSGYSLTKAMLNGAIEETWYFPLVKYLATLFTYLSGIPGGIFAPALSIGAGIGYDLTILLGHQELSLALIALCMTSFLSGVTQAPITSFIIVMEMIDGHEMVISLMAVALIANIVSKLFTRPLYSTLSKGYAKISPL